MHPPSVWSDGLGATSLAIIESAAKRKEQQKIAFVEAKLAEANKYLRDYRKSKGCRELTQAELDGDWSQSISCGCDLGPRHPTSLQLLAREACGSQDIPKAFQLSSDDEELGGSPQREVLPNQSRNNQAKQKKT
jgi:hypothetical protein